MSVQLKELSEYLDKLLEIDNFQNDSSNNGLQVEGRQTVNKIVFAVDACRKVFDYAVEKDADFVFVHHGLSWKDNLKRLVGLTAERLRILFKNDVSLYAAHLPLDAHRELGHNAKMAEMLKLSELRPFGEYCGYNIGVMGIVPQETDTGRLAEELAYLLQSQYEIYGNNNKEVRKVAIVSGGAAGLIEQAKDTDIDVFITGEMAHSVWHCVLEIGIPVITFGHYATEKPGICAVMNIVKQEFDLDCEFADFPTGL